MAGEQASQRHEPLRPRAGGWAVSLLAALVCLAFVISLGVGPVRLMPGEAISALLSGANEAHRIIVMEIRLPRAILALAIGGDARAGRRGDAGAAPESAGGPQLFGAPQSAALAAVTTISLGVNDTLSWGLPVAAILGAFLSVFLLLGIAGRNAGLLLLILSGLAVSSLAGAGTVLAMNLAPNPFAALEIAFWLLGSLEDRSMRHVMLALPFIALAALLLLMQGRAFRALSLGEEAAESIGGSMLRGCVCWSSWGLRWALAPRWPSPERFPSSGLWRRI